MPIHKEEEWTASGEMGFFLLHVAPNSSQLQKQKQEEH